MPSRQRRPYCGLECSAIKELLSFYCKSMTSVPDSTNQFKIKRAGFSVEEKTFLVVQNVLLAPSMSGLMVGIVKLAVLR